MYNKNKNTNVEVETNLEELRQQATPSSKLSTFLFVLFLICLILAIILTFSDTSSSTVYTLVFLAFIFMLGGTFAGNKSAKYFRKMTLTLEKTNMISEVLQEFFTDFKHEKKNHIPKEIIKETKLITNYDSFRGNDYICGKYKGVDFESCDVLLKYSEPFGDGVHTKTIFYGFWMIIPFNSPMDNLSILEQSVGNVKEKTFDERFVIKVEDVDMDSNVLTPEFRTQIMQLSNRFREKYSSSRFYLGFRGNKLHIAVYNRHDNFEVDITKLESLADIKVRFRSEAAYILDIIETIGIRCDN